MRRYFVFFFSSLVVGAGKRIREKNICEDSVYVCDATRFHSRLGF